MSTRSEATSTLLGELNGSPQYLGTLTASNTAGTANVGFAIDPAGVQLLVIPDADCYLGTGADTTTALANAVAATGVDLFSGDRWFVRLFRGEAGIAVKGKSATVNLKVFLVK